MKRILAINASLIFLLAGNSIASPITLSNLLNLASNGVASSVSGSGELIDYGRGTADLFDGAANYTIWSHALNFNPQTQFLPETLNGVLPLRFHSGDNPGLPDLTLDLADQETDARTDSCYCSVYMDNGRLVVKLLSLNDRFLTDSSALPIAYDSVSEPISAPVPEPAGLLLFGIAITISGILIRKRSA
jgi:hypothetical protein